MNFGGKLNIFFSEHSRYFRVHFRQNFLTNLKKNIHNFCGVFVFIKGNMATPEGTNGVFRSHDG